MKVYVFGSEDFDGLWIYGIYSSKEKALESRPFHCNELDESNIFEFEVDPPHGPDTYEDQHYFAISTTGETRAGTHWVKSPFQDEVRFFETLDSPLSKGSVFVFGYAHTPEEASRLALEEFERRGLKIKSK